METLSAPPGRAPPKSASGGVAWGIVCGSFGDRSVIGWGSFGHRLWCVSRFLVFLFFSFSDFLVFLLSHFITFWFSRFRSRFRSPYFRFHFLVSASDALFGSMSTRVKRVAESKESIIKYWACSRMIPAFYSCSLRLALPSDREITRVDHSFAIREILIGYDEVEVTTATTISFYNDSYTLRPTTFL